MAAPAGYGLGLPVRGRRQRAGQTPVRIGRLWRRADRYLVPGGTVSEVTIRGYLPSDVEAVVRVINACNEADGWSFRENVQSFQLRDSDPAIHLDRHSLIVAADAC